jgi:anti-sigma regulatory factor (Ser/Thr protein kinase)
VTGTETRGLPGVPASAAAARAFVREALAAAGCPDSDGPELCASELVANSVEHSRSAGPAGTVMLRVDTWCGGARLEVRDAGPLPGELPAVVGAEPALDGESGRGLWLVFQVADTCGFAPGVAWCLFSWPCEGAGVPPLAAIVPAPRLSRRVQRRPGRLAGAAHRVALWRHRRYAARPLEREARDVLGVPWRYPENLTRRQHQLDRLAAELWPNCEYMREIR